MKMNLRRILLVAITALIAVSAAAPVYAVNPHEDPARAQPVYSGVTLFRYYSNAIDAVIAKNTEAVYAKLDKMPYANLPGNLTEVTDNFVFSIEDCVKLIVSIDRNMGDLRVLIGQSRLTEAMPLAVIITGDLTSAYGDVHRAQDAVTYTGATFGVLLEPGRSEIRLAYEGTMNKLSLVLKMLDLYRDLLANMFKGTASGSVATTQLTLKIEPDSAFVGDSVKVSGRLTTKGTPLAGRNINILFNSSRQAAARTDVGGLFTATLNVPYWYSPDIEVQALYYPEGADVGVYLAGLSPVVILNVLYYEATLSLTFDGAAYPGRESTMTAELTYSPSAAMLPRDLEIYLDNVLLDRFTASGSFTRAVAVPRDAKVGKHTVTVAAPADGRYAPILADAVLDVQKAQVKLNMSMPRLIFVPGGLNLNGSAASDLGPLQDALVKVAAGSNTLEFRTGVDGTFRERMKLRFEFGLVGTAGMDVNIYPREPWNQPFTVSTKVFVINSVMAGVFILLVAAVGVFLPLRLKIRSGYPARRRKIAQPAITGNIRPLPEYSDLVTVPASTDAGQSAIKVEPRVRIFSWYALILRLAQKFARVVLKPHQTHREFVNEIRKVLGPLADYLMDFTRMVERLLYSRSRATETDVARSEQLSRRLQDGLRDRQ